MEISQNEIKNRKNNPPDILKKPNNEKKNNEDVNRNQKITNLYEESKVEFVNSLNLEEPRFLFLRIPVTILCCSLLSWIVGYFNLSFTFILFIVYCFYSMYSRSVQKFKKSMGAIVFKSERRRQVCEMESVEWINFALERVWMIIESEISKEVFRTVNPLLAEKCPSFLAGLAISEFTLGSVPPIIKGISFDSKREKNIISFDCDIFFIPLQINKGAATLLLEESMNWNSRIVLCARLGLALKGKGLDVPVLVENFSFHGKARITMKLSRNLNMPVKQVEFCFLSLPEIDFDLSPLKTIDLMNLPGLSSFIHSLINSNLEKELVDPNLIKIDLETKEKKLQIPQGIVLLHIYSMYNKNDESCIGEIDVDGRRIYRTQQREGTRMVFNEYFFIILNKNDEMLNVKFHSKFINSSQKYGTAGICLKKLRSIGSILQDTKIWRKGNIKSVLEIDVKFYPIIEGPAMPNKHISAQAIVIMNVQYIENLQGQKKTRNRLYNSFVQVMVCKKIDEKDIQKADNSHDFFMSALKASGSLSKNIADSITKNLKAGLNTFLNTNEEDVDALQSASESTFFIGRTRKVMETRSPMFDEKFEFFSRNLQNDIIYLSVIDQQDNENETIGELKIPLKEVFDGMEEVYKIINVQSGKIKISFNMHYITPFISPFKKYESALRIRLSQLVTTYDDGIFYAVVKNRYESFFVDTFCFGDLPINREIIIPAESDDDHLKIYLFRENLHNSDFIGEGKIEMTGNIQQIELTNKNDLSGTLTIEVDVEPLFGVGCSICSQNNSFNDENIQQSAISSNQIDKIDCVLHHDDFTPLNPCESSASASFLRREVLQPKVSTNSSMFHVVQIGFKHFENVQEDFFIEFVSNGEIIKKSGLIKPHNKSKLEEIEKNILVKYEHCRLNSNCEVFTILSGENPIYARLRTSEFGETKIIGECFVPKKCINEKISLGDDMVVELTVCSQKAAFKWRDYFKIGYLEIRILNAFRIRGVEKNNTSDPYVKVYLNNNKIYKTKTIQSTTNPVWNENLFVNVNIMTDILRFEVIDWNRIESNQLISFIEIPLYFLVEGFTEVNLGLIDALKMRKDGSILHLGFKFDKKYKGDVNIEKIAVSHFI